VKLWKDGKITATEAIKQAGMTRTTFYKLVKAERGQA
jgi:ACT domain-containing protein